MELQLSNNSKKDASSRVVNRDCPGTEGTSNSNGPTSAQPNEKAKTVLPVAIQQSSRIVPKRIDPNWKAKQLRKLEVLEVMESVPKEMRDAYCKLFAKRGINIREDTINPNQHYLHQNFTSGPYIQNRQQEFRGKNNKNEEHDKRNGSTLQKPRKPRTTYEASDEAKNGTGMRFCHGCKMDLRRAVYYHHARMLRDHGRCDLYTPQRFPCNMCDMKLGTLEKLCLHLYQLHGAPTDIKTIYFDTEDDFAQFRLELEGKGGNFRMSRGGKRNKKGLVHYFRCNRTQTISRDKTIQLLKSNGLPPNRAAIGEEKYEEDRKAVKQVIRTEESCTAFFIKAYLEDNRIEVRYCDYHLHDDEKLRLPEAVRLRILEMARKGLPHPVIIMVIKEEMRHYSLPNTAIERRIREIKPQDIRQVIAAHARSEKSCRPRRKNHNVPLFYGLAKEDLEVYDEYGFRNPYALTEVERKCLRQFEDDRDSVIAEIEVKEKTDAERRQLFESTRDLIESFHKFTSVLDTDHCPIDLLPEMKDTLDDMAELLDVRSKKEDLAVATMMLNTVHETEGKPRISLSYEPKTNLAKHRVRFADFRKVRFMDSKDSSDYSETHRDEEEPEPASTGAKANSGDTFKPAKEHVVEYDEHGEEILVEDVSDEESFAKPGSSYKSDNLKATNSLPHRFLSQNNVNIKPMSKTSILGGARRSTVARTRIQTGSRLNSARSAGNPVNQSGVHSLPVTDSATFVNKSQPSAYNKNTSQAADKLRISAEGFKMFKMQLQTKQSNDLAAINKEALKPTTSTLYTDSDVQVVEEVIIEDGHFDAPTGTSLIIENTTIESPKEKAKPGRKRKDSAVEDEVVVVDVESDQQIEPRRSRSGREIKRKSFYQ